ncbi:MAG: response regulator [Nitrospirota bacterium]
MAAAFKPFPRISAGMIHEITNDYLEDATMTELKTQSLLPILIVDDEPNILSSLKRLLADEPYEILTAASGKEGIKIITGNRTIGVILSDQRMPEMNGAEFLEKAKTLVPDAARIVLTGYADIQAAVDAINKGGATRYIAKPWNDQELITIVREAASRYALLQENKRLTEIVHRQNARLKQWSSQLEHDVQRKTMEIQKKNEELNSINKRLK